MKKCNLRFVVKGAIVSSCLFFSSFLAMAGVTLPKLTKDQLHQVMSSDKFIFEQREGEADLAVEIKEDRTICWYSSEITDEILAAVLGKYDGFTKLSLQKCAITDGVLKKLPNGLVWLDLSYTEITDKGLKHLYPLKSLEHLDLVDCQQLTPEGIWNLSQKISNIEIVTYIEMGNYGSGPTCDPTSGGELTSGSDFLERTSGVELTSGGKRCIVQ